MKPGINVGQSISIEVEVTEEMFPCFEGKLVHPVFSTASLVHHMEWASRLLLLPYLEEGEEGMGASVNVKHLAPSILGERVSISAKIKRVTFNSLITEVRAETQKGIIGTGEVKQVILLKSKIYELLKP